VPGMVITNEPGIYIPDEALGVRIENDFLITADGAENLSSELPTAAEEIEAMMKAG
jgi:Xaa-Pro aminopeptidase